MPERPSILGRAVDRGAGIGHEAELAQVDGEPVGHMWRQRAGMCPILTGHAAATILARPLRSRARKGASDGR